MCAQSHTLAVLYPISISSHLHSQYTENVRYEHHREILPSPSHPHTHTPTHPHTHTHTSDENPESTGRLLGFRGNVAKWLATLPLQEERETK